MTTNQNHIPEPTSPTAVVVGKRDGETLVARRVDNDDLPWALAIEGHCEWHSWTGLCREMTDIRVVPMAELDAKPEPGVDIRYEVAAAAGEKIMELADKFIRVEVLRAALAAADAKRAELEGGEQA